VAIRRSLAPYGVRDLLVQIGLWVVFGLAYEAVRGAVVHDRARAFGDSKTIIDLERRTQRHLTEVGWSAVPAREDLRCT
jgi:hypothetical protein